MKLSLDQSIAVLLPRISGMADGARHLIAIVGAPGSGKSTLSRKLCDALNTNRSGIASVVPMDGFHYDDAVLSARGVLQRKGAPFTFDVGGLKSLLERLCHNQESEIAIPNFDRKLELSRAGANLISNEVQLLLVEGNYLLLNQAPWSDLRRFFDLTIRLDVPDAELERRLIARWQRYGFSRDEAKAKALDNDLPNARLVQSSSADADIVIRQC